MHMHTDKQTDIYIDMKARDGFTPIEALENLSSLLVCGCVWCVQFNVQREKDTAICKHAYRCQYKHKYNGNKYIESVQCIWIRHQHAYGQCSIVRFQAISMYACIRIRLDVHCTLHIDVNSWNFYMQKEPHTRTPIHTAYKG